MDQKAHMNMRAETLLSTRRPRIESLETDEGGRHAANGDKNIAKMQNNKSPTLRERGGIGEQEADGKPCGAGCNAGRDPCGAGSMRGGMPPSLADG